MTEERHSLNLEALLSDALRPIEPPDDLVSRFEPLGAPAELPGPPPVGRKRESIFCADPARDCVMEAGSGSARLA